MMYLDSDYGGPVPSPRRDRQAMRRDLTDIIERAIAALDALDGDPEREDDDPQEDSDPHEGADDDDNGIADDGGLCEQCKGEGDLS